MSFRLVIPILLSLFIFSPVAQAFQGHVQSFGKEGAIAWGNGELSVVQAVEKVMMKRRHIRRWPCARRLPRLVGFCLIWF